MEEVTQPNRKPENEEGSALLIQFWLTASVALRDTKAVSRGPSYLPSAPFIKDSMALNTAMLTTRLP